MTELKFTGEYFVPGQSPKRIEDDHVERYNFACRIVRGKAVLDIACGAGYGAKLMADAGAERAIGVDISTDNVDYANGVYACERTTFLQGDITNFDSGGPYDVITCFETIEHVEDYKGALVNLKRLLAPDGKLLISSPNRPITSPEAKRLVDKPDNEFHVREFTVGELVGALHEAGFETDPAEIYGQRLQPYFAFKKLRKFYAKRWRPHENASPVVAPLGRLTPRYFLIVAARK